MSHNSLISSIVSNYDAPYYSEQYYRNKYYDFYSIYDQLMVDYDPEKQCLLQAVTLVSCLWKGIQARRRLIRLRIGREIEHLPGRGIKYLMAHDQFYSLINHI